MQLPEQNNNGVQGHFNANQHICRENGEDDKPHFRWYGLHNCPCSLVALALGTRNRIWNPSLPFMAAEFASSFCRSSSGSSHSVDIMIIIEKFVKCLKNGEVT